MKKSGVNLLPHEIITYSPTRIRNKKKKDISHIQRMETTSMEMTSIETTSMENRQLHSSQKEAMKKIAEFSGESNELDIDEWLFDLTNLFSLMKLKDESKILETMGKLTGPALRWYQENLRSFINWDDAEQTLRNRFKEFIPDSQLMREFFQIQQEENQSVISFYEHVIRKYKKAKKFITEQQVITVLQAGVKNSLKEHLIRNEKEIKKPDEWLQLAREEEYIQKLIQQEHNGLSAAKTKQPYFESILPTTTIQPRPSNAQSLNQYAYISRNYNKKQHQRPHKLGNNRTYQKQNNRQNIEQNREIYVAKKMQQTNSCLICNRKNHSTSKCFYKKENGCYRCGQSNHQIRDCPQRHFFE